MVKPVTFPPGRAKLATSPDSTGLPLDANDRYRAGRRFGRQGAGRASRHDDIRLRANQLGCQGRETIVHPFGPAVLDSDVFALDMAKVAQLLPERIDEMAFQGWR